MATTLENLFTAEEKQAIVQAITRAEHRTSGEIRLHVESHCQGDPKNRAAQVFKVLKMHRTKERNGVLIYFAFKARKFAIVGDAGINRLVPDNFWEDVKELMLRYFVRRKYAKGLIAGIEQVGEKLHEYFPWQDDDVNELPDEISFGV